MPVRINFNIDIDPVELNPDLRQYIDWSRIPESELQLMPVDLVLYAPIPKLLSVLNTQKYSNVSDEDVLSIIARTMNEIKKTHNNFNSETNLIRFLYQFPRPGFLQQYYRQIMALNKMYCDKECEKLLGFFAMNGLIAFENIYTIPYYTINHEHFMSPDVNYELRKKMMKYSNYYAYKANCDAYITELVIVLKTKDLEELGLPVPIDINSNVAVNFSPVSNAFKDYSSSRKYMDWDDLVDMYLNRDINYLQIAYLWESYINGTIYDGEDVKYNSFNRHCFSEDDFKC